MNLSYGLSVRNVNVHVHACVFSRYIGSLCKDMVVRQIEQTKLTIGVSVISMLAL